MANGHGGARNGSGRRRSAIRLVMDTVKDAADRQLCEHIPTLIENMLVLANGVAIQKNNSEGESYVYTNPPDRAANEYLINRVMGKPTEMTEAEVNVKGGVTIFLPERKAD